jgi:hypothetical protein
MNKLQIITLLIVMCLLAGAAGGVTEKYFQQQRNKQTVIKHIATNNSTVDYHDISVTADMTFFWIDTHSERWDCKDDSVGMTMKLHGALMKAVKYCESKDIEIDHNNLLLFYTHIVKNFYETDGPFNSGLDWVSFNIKAITYPTKEKQHITVGTNFGSGVIINPYYKDNIYFKKRFLKKKSEPRPIGKVVGVIKTEYPVTVLKKFKKRKEKALAETERQRLAYENLDPNEQRAMREDARQVLKNIEEMRQKRKKEREADEI